MVVSNAQRRIRIGPLSKSLLFPPWALLIGIAFVVVSNGNAATYAFSVPPSRAKITVYPVTTQADVLALADLRYDEWIAGGDNGEPNGSPPTRFAFRMATAEIAAERSEGGARTFLARLNDDSSPSIAVGAAELSPIEFNGAETGKYITGDASSPKLYVTDVVTSSKHRRMGIANSLMDAVELCACDMCNDNDILLYLHVKRDNEPALNFYSNPKRGYAVPRSEQLKGIDVNQLEKNAGTAGQILLHKAVKCNQGKASVGTGFGGATEEKANKAIPKKKAKRKKR
mmetsp:Transcript_6814/g.14294  ORF Transcript_6814/g.14294 Transcript_6814/m.14294 type:complete len:285 (-) Transcript_6814:4-858(-)